VQGPGETSDPDRRVAQRWRKKKHMLAGARRSERTAPGLGPEFVIELGIKGGNAGTGSSLQKVGGRGTLPK